MRAASAHLPVALLLLYFGVVFHGVLFTTEGAFERDAFYHARYAQMLPERGLSRKFPWMQFTAWKDEFADKDFLYHIYLAPFCRNAAEPLPGAKWATLLLSLVGLTLIYAMLVRLRVPWALFWVALLAVGSGLYLNRMLMVRSHVFSIVLMILASYAIFKERIKTTFIIAFFYPWAYSFPLAMMITAVAASTGRLLLSGRPWRVLQIPAVVAAGIALGLLIHPYSPNSLNILWEFLKISFSRAEGIKLELGSEFMPMATFDALTSFDAFWRAILSILISLPGPLIALCVSGALAFRLKRGAIKDRMLSNESAAALGAAGVWFAGLFVFSRLIEYFAPIATFAAALTVRDALGPHPRLMLSELEPRKRIRLLCGFLAATVMIAGFNYLAVDEIAYPLVRSTRNQFAATSNDFETEKAWRRNRFFDGACSWLRSHLKPGEVVIDFHWDDFPELFYGDPQQYYLVGLDPTFMRLSYPQHSATLEAMRTKQIPLDFSKLKSLFGADYVVMRLSRAAEFPELSSHSYVPIYSDRLAVIYKIAD